MVNWFAVPASWPGDTLCKTNVNAAPGCTVIAAEVPDITVSVAVMVGVWPELVNVNPPTIATPALKV